jgi:O-methyltransferase
MAIDWLARMRFVLNKAVGRIDSRLNLDEINRYWNYPRTGDAYLEAYQHSRRLTGSTDDLAKQMRFYTLMQAVGRVASGRVTGDVVECGCWRGHSSHMIARALSASDWAGRLLIFDSFEGGLSDKDAQDRAQLGDTDPEATLRQKLLFASSQEAVAAVHSPFEFVELHKGWIPEVFAQVEGLEARRFALVHLDVDLYAPTLASLRFFAPRMSKGGLIVVDDYASNYFPGATSAVDEFIAEHPPELALEGHAGGIVLLY